MPQGLVKKNISNDNRKQKPKGEATQSRKQAPSLVKSNPYLSARRAATSAINRRIESLMLGRFAHEGGTLAVLPKPDNVDRYINSHSAVNQKQKKQLIQSSLARRSRQKREGLVEGSGRISTNSTNLKQNRISRKRNLLNEMTREEKEDAALEAIRFESEDESDFEDLLKSDDDGDHEEKKEKDVQQEDKKNHKRRKLDSKEERTDSIGDRSTAEEDINDNSAESSKEGKKDIERKELDIEEETIHDNDNDDHDDEGEGEEEEEEEVEPESKNSSSISSLLSSSGLPNNPKESLARGASLLGSWFNHRDKRSDTARQTRMEMKAKKS